MQEYRNFYIGGQWVAPHAGTDHHVINPSTEEPCAVISLGGQADTDAAVAAAKAALPAWMNTSPADRIALLERICTEYVKRHEDLAQATSMEMGAPIDMARQQQVTSGDWHFEGFIKAAKSFEFERVMDGEDNDVLRYEPIGVVAMITPWNWPQNQIALKVGAAIASGCTMILKPSEESPINAMIFAEVMEAAGVPAGVFNLINGDGAGVGTQLTAHRDVDMVSFTGSSRAGTLISKNAADTLKRVHLELGGKGANIIFADADDKAVKRGVLSVMNNSGQSCNAPTRMLVERARYDAAVQEAAQVATSIVSVGPSDQEGRHIGPVVNQTQYEKIQAMIQTGIDEGARLVAGGTGRPDGLNQGFFVKPTVFADVRNDMVIAQQEIFGPVLSILPFDTEEDAVHMANDTVYGLTNYVQTSDVEKLRRVARQMRSGMVQANGASRAQTAPFGGMKQSGNGREGGKTGIEEFCELKVMSGWNG